MRSVVNCVRLLLVAVLSFLGPAVALAQSPTAATFEPLSSVSTATAGSTVHLALRVVLPEGLHAQSNKPRDPSLIPTTLSFEPGTGIAPSEVVFPPAQDFKLETGDMLLVFEREFIIGVAATIEPGASGVVTLNGRIRYQPCNDVMCFRPITTAVSWTIPVGATAAIDARQTAVFSKIAFGKGDAPTIAAPGSPVAPSSPDNPLTGSPAPPLTAIETLNRFETRQVAGGYMNVATFTKFIADAEAGVKSSGPFEGEGPLAIILLVFLGGLALNLTPCVLPMIPINLAIIGAGAQSSDKRRGFLLGMSYGAAMALVYGVIGLVVILTAGTFGAINSSPWFNAAIAVLFVVLGLAMFDIGVIDFSKWSSRFQFSGMSRGSFALAFGMGAVAALLAGACVAPVVIQVVIFASDLYAKGSSVALALPFVLGLGMALPWPMAGAGLSRLPKPGAWMNRVKYAFGVFILATAAYYGYLTYEIVSNRWVNTADVQASAEEKLREGWYSSLDDGLRVAETTGQPVLIDMWATWCKNCLTMDKTTLADPQVKAALTNYVKIKFQAEDLDAPDVKAVMQRFDAVGLPAYAIIKNR
jgi:cytochrome c biogenesis protein CcdA/thiol-disulfide isomerase/thioredoxin